MMGREIQRLTRQLRSGELSGSELRQSAARLGAQGPEHQAVAAAALHASDYPMSVAREVAVVLAGFAPEHRAPLAQKLRAAAADESSRDQVWGFERRVWAAEALACLGPEYAEEARTRLLALIAEPRPMDTCVVTRDRWMAAEVLADCFPGSAELAAEVIRSGTASYESPENELLRAAALRRLGGRYVAESLALLEEVRTSFQDDQEVLNQITLITTDRFLD